jgi:CHAT domain-containing protein/tetratricopeptide (TPR) repeat protein
MRWCLVGCFLAALAGCSRQQSATEAYSEAWNAFREGKLELAQKLTEAALKNQKTDPLSLLQSEILLSRGQAPHARELLDRMSDPPVPLNHLRWLVDRATALSRLGQRDKAIELLDEVDRTSGDNSNSDPVLTGRLLRGAMLARSGRFEQADQVLEKTAALAANAGDSFNQAAALLNLSYSKFKSGHYDESLNYSRPALEAGRKAHARRIEALANNNLGMAYTVLRDLTRAEQYQNQAVTQLREIGDLRNLQIALGELGNVHMLSHELDRADQDFKQAIGIAKSIEDTEDAVEWAGQLSAALIGQQKWDAAESWNRQAIALLEPFGGPDQAPLLKLNTAAIANGRGNHEEAAQLYCELIAQFADDPYLAWNAHMRLGSLYAAEKNFKDANAEYEAGLAVIERIRRSSVAVDEHRLSYQDGQMEFFKDYVELLVTEGHNEQALQVAEYSRARVLTDKLGREADRIGQVSPASFRRYAAQSGEVLLSYWLGKERSFVWVVKPGGIRMEPLPRQSEIAALVHTYRTMVADDLRDPAPDRLPQAERLSQMLLGPVQADLAGASKVIVVPDGELHALNLETLPVPGTGRYWIEDVELSVAPSLNLLMDTPHKIGSKPSLLLVGAPGVANPDYPELPAAKAEIDEIQGRFPASEKVVRTGSAATPHAFLDSKPSSFAMIHFAAHAEANPESPLDSAVILSKDGDNYKLYARDITDLALSADLVTLSACRSAGARAYGGEGLVGFAWAFLQSGAHAVIAGLWDVGDTTSSRLMAKLYEGLASGMTPAAALRQAKLTLLHSAAYKKPFYWAPFQTYIR